jgi:hypothetical protein
VLPTGDPEWGDMKEAGHIRRMLRFPRSPQELVVHPENVETLTDAFLWFVQRAADLVEVCEKSILETFDEWEKEDEQNDAVM